MSKRAALPFDIFKNVAAALILALIGAAVKLYIDVQDLKMRFEFINGSGWTVPKH